MPALRRAVVAALTSALLAAVSASPAFSDPTRAPHAVSGTFTCDSEQLTVVSANEPTPTLHVIAATSVLIATDATVTVAFVDPQTGEPVTTTQQTVFGAGHGQAQGLQSKLITCDNTFTVQDPDLGTVAFAVTGTFLLTPPTAQTT